MDFCGQTIENERWLITGGLGYIGSHVAREFIESGKKVVILDNLSTGLIDRLPTGIDFIESDVRDSRRVYEICKDFSISGIAHLASFKHARESKRNPTKYLANNIGATVGLVEGIVGTDVKKFIFSSSCSIYGDANDVNENSNNNPQSPYAESKLISESIFTQCLESIGVSYTALRYFNVIGCDGFPSSADQSDECLVPVITKKMRQGAPLEIYGTDLPTPDGTCLRDYLDVRDVAKAHTVIANSMLEVGFPKIFNLSSGVATSVLQVINAFEVVTEMKLPVIKAAKNPADPVAIWSQKSKRLEEMGWNPEYTLQDSIAAHISQCLHQ
jgi:UDP-glucose 4-epimerase